MYLGNNNNITILCNVIINTIINLAAINPRYSISIGTHILYLLVNAIAFV